VKRVCTNCGIITPDGSLWCQSRDCPSGTLTTLFDYGEWLGNLEIIRLLRVLRLSAIYEARRGTETVLLKVAHDECSEQLKREGTTLQQLAAVAQHPMLPVLLPPYPYDDTQHRPYGKTVFQDETKYYLVFKYVKGEFLRDTLVKNPQPWYQHVAWLTISLADAIAFLNVKGGKLLLNLSPESILVRTDRDGILRPLLVDLGMVSEPQGIDLAMVQRYSMPAYIAPELLEKGITPGPATDVYGLGLLLYEMLAGHPAFPFHLQKAEDVLHAVHDANPPPLERTDLAEDILAVVNQSLAKIPARRLPDVISFAKALRVKFGEVPAERVRRGLLDRRNLAIAAFAMLAIIVWIVLSALIT
jgi:serine/threonine protein kinase